MAAVMLQDIASFFQKISETSLFISTDYYEKFLVCRDYYVAAHDPAFCFFFENCKFHLLLIAGQGWIWMIYSSNWTVFASQINTLIVSTPHSSSYSLATFWRKREKYSIVWKEPFRSTNSTKVWIICPALQKKTTQEEVQKTHADISSTVNFSSNNRISFCGESQ